LPAKKIYGGKNLSKIDKNIVLEDVSKTNGAIEYSIMFNRLSQN
jgi:hypothetical protein